MITGKSFTPQYDAREDRIRLILNYANPNERTDLLITRAMILKLIPVLERVLPHGAKAIEMPSHESQPIPQGVETTDAATLEFTQLPQSVLLAKIDFKVHKEQHHVTLLFYEDVMDTPHAQATLMEEALQQIIGLMLGVIPFEWGIARNILEH